MLWLDKITRDFAAIKLELDPLHFLKKERRLTALGFYAVNEKRGIHQKGKIEVNTIC